MVLESSIKTLYDYFDGWRAIMPPFDDVVLAGILVTLMLGGMRLLYGSWPWEASKTWYRTRQAVDYVDALRAETKSSPVVAPVQDVTDINAPSDVSDAVDTSVLRKLLNTVDSTSDSFDRGPVLDNFAPEEASQAAVSASAMRNRRPSLKSNHRKQPIQVAQTRLASASDPENAQERAPSTPASALTGS